MDAAEYKHVVLGLIFLKYISDAFEAKLSEGRRATTNDRTDHRHAMVAIERDNPSLKFVLPKGLDKQRLGQLINLVSGHRSWQPSRPLRGDARSIINLSLGNGRPRFRNKMCQSREIPPLSLTRKVR